MHFSLLFLAIIEMLSIEQSHVTIGVQSICVPDFRLIGRDHPSDHFLLLASTERKRGPTQRKDSFTGVFEADTYAAERKRLQIATEKMPADRCCDKRAVAKKISLPGELHDRGNLH
jgi:hypothetical protein